MHPGLSFHVRAIPLQEVISKHYKGQSWETFWTPLQHNTVQGCPVHTAWSYCPKRTITAAASPLQYGPFRPASRQKAEGGKLSGSVPSPGPRLIIFNLVSIQLTWINQVVESVRDPCTVLSRHDPSREPPRGNYTPSMSMRCFTLPMF